MPWGISRALRILAPIVVVLVVLGAFFFIYNQVVVDVNVRNLRVALRVLENASSVGQAEAAIALVDQNLLYTVALVDHNPAEVAALEYARGVLSADPSRTVQDAQTMVSSVVEQRGGARQGLATALEGLGQAVGDAVQQLALVPRRMGPGSARTMKMDLDRLAQAGQLEREGRLQEAAEAYRALLQEFPAYAERNRLKLRLGFLYHRQQSFANAERLYREVLAETNQLTEVKETRQLITQLHQSRLAFERAGVVERELRAASRPEERQRVAFEVGVHYMLAFDLEAAIRNFEVAAAARPNTPLATQARFRHAWCMKYLGRQREATRLFQELGRQKVDPGIAMEAQIQVADGYRAAGQHDLATELLNTVAGQTQDSALASVLIAQAGSIALVEQRNPQKAEQLFQRLETSFPASSVGMIRESIQSAPLQVQPSVPGAPPGALEVKEHGPVLEILQVSIPGMAETFANRLAEYMRGVGTATFTRRLTENDFRQLVVKRVQERYGNRLQHIRIEMTPTGFDGAASVRAAGLWIPIAGQAGVFIERGRPQVRITRLTIMKAPVPDILLRLVSSKINGAIDQAQLPLEVTRFTVREDAVDIETTLLKSEKAARQHP